MTSFYFALEVMESIQLYIWSEEIDQKFASLLRWRSGKESTCKYRRSEFNPLGQKDSLEEEVATFSNIIA